MTAGVTTIIIPVKDAAAAKPVYSRLLGAEPVVDQPYYIGYRVDGQDIGLDPNGHGKGMAGPVAYFNVDDINTTLQALLDAGATTQQPVTDVGGGKLIATVADADGNVVGLMQP